MRKLLPTALFTLLSTSAFAHVGVGETSGFLHGFGHPVSGIDHILAMVAVGVFAFVLGGRALYLVPVSFVGMMIVGFLLGVGHVDVPFVEFGIGLSSVVIGCAAAIGRPMPVIAAMALVGLFAIFHGHAHGAEMPDDAGGVTYALGFIVATALLHLTGVAAALGMTRTAGSDGRTVARVAGAAFAAGGVGVLFGWV